MWPVRSVGSCDFGWRHSRVMSGAWHLMKRRSPSLLQKTNNVLCNRGHRIRAANTAWTHPAWLLAFQSERRGQYSSGWWCTALLSTSRLTSPPSAVTHEGYTRKRKYLRADCSGKITNCNESISLNGSIKCQQCFADTFCPITDVHKEENQRMLGSYVRYSFMISPLSQTTYNFWTFCANPCP